MDATHLRNDGWDFLNLGYAVERADNTARLMDVKYYVLLPQVEYVGSGLDNYQWETLLRSMSAYRSYRWAYGGDLSAQRIAHFLILNTQCPRALLTSIQTVNTHIEQLARGYGQSSAALSMARGLLAEITEMTIEEALDEGLHEFLTRFIQEVAQLGGSISEVYFSGDQR